LKRKEIIFYLTELLLPALLQCQLQLSKHYLITKILK